MTRSHRGGFTLVELIVVTVLGAVLIAATLQVLITNQRTYTAQSAQILGSQAVRAALDVLSAELREISPEGGDLVVMDSDQVEIRAQRKVGLVCNDTAMGIGNRRVLKVGDWFEVDDSVFVFADNDGTSADDDAWILTRITNVDTTVGCGSLDGQRLTFVSSAPFAADSVSSGAEVRSFVHVTYGLMTYGGDTYLGRSVAGGDWTPVVGPLAKDGLAFVYRDAQGDVTTTAADVRQIDITVKTEAEVTGPTGVPVSDSVTVRVFPRN